MKLLYYRIFVTKVTQQSLFPDTTSTKPELIEQAFGNFDEPFYFHSGEHRYAYKIQKKVGSYIYASLAKEGSVKIQKSPEEDFATESIPSWPTVPLIINTSGDPSIGQSLAVELNSSIFQNPHIQLYKLISELNRNILRAKGYEMAINAISEEDGFWDVVGSNEGGISYIEFSYAAPNLFDGKDSLNEELRNARDALGMTNTTIKLENSEGELRVPRDDRFVNQSVGYVSEGGGGYKIKLKNSKIIQSGDSIKSRTIEKTQLEIAATNSEELKAFCDTLFSWLKR